MSEQIVCPKCGSDNVQRYAVLHSHGTSQINTTSRTAGVGFSRGGMGFGGAKTSTSGVQQTAIGKLTSPPAKRRYRLQVGLILISIIVSGIVGGVAGTVLFILLAAACIFWLVKNIQWNRNFWPRLYAEWDNTFLCNKCGVSFEHGNEVGYSEVAATLE